MSVRYYETIKHYNPIAESPYYRYQGTEIA